MILMLAGLWFCTGCARLSDLEQARDETEQARWLALLGIHLGQRRTDTLVDNGDGTVTVPYYGITLTRCRLGLSGNRCAIGTAATYSYCNATDNSCNGSTNVGVLDGNGVSQAYAACNSLALGGRNWQVPDLSEVQMFLDAFVSNVELVGSDIADNAWTRQSKSATSVFIWSAIGVSFLGSKTAVLGLHCIMK